MPPEKMMGMASQLYSLAFDYDADFHWIDKITEATSLLSHHKLEEYSKQFLSRSNPRRLAILMHGKLASQNEFSYESVDRKDLYNIGTFVSYK